MGRTIGFTFEVGARLQSSVASVFDTVAGRAGNLKREMSQLRAVSGAAGKLTSAKASVDALRAEAAAGKDVARQLTAAEKAYASAQRSAARYNVSVQQAASVHARATAQMQRTEAALQRQETYQRNAAKRNELKGDMMGTVASVAAVATPIKMAMDFESAMADAAKTIEGMRDKAGNLTPEYYAMEAAVKRLGRTLPLTHEELARLFAAGGQQGFKATADLEEFTTLSAHMAVAFGMSTDEAADAIGGYRTALKLSMPEVRGVLDLMNQFANTTSASEKGIADIVRRIGPLGSVGGVAAKPMTALAATLDAMKVSPEVAATGIKNMILAMTAGTAATKAQRSAYAQLGIDTVQLAKQMQTDGPAAILSVLEAVKKLPKAQQLSIMQEIFGKESLGSIAPLLDNLELVKKNLITAGDGAAYAGAMQAEFENRSKTTSNNVIRSLNKVAEIGVTVGTTLLPVVNDLLDVFGAGAVAVANFAAAHPEVVRVTMMAATAMAAFKVATLAGGFALSAASSAWTMAKGVWAAGRAVCDLSTYSMLAQRTASFGLAVGVRAVAAAQWVLNAAMSNNPVGWVIKGVVFLGGALYTLYQTCEPVRTVLDSLWDGFLAAAKPVTSFVTTVWDKVKKIMSWFGGGEAGESAAAADTQLSGQTSPDASQNAPDAGQASPHGGQTAGATAVQRPAAAGATPAAAVSRDASSAVLPPGGMTAEEADAFMAQAPGAGGGAGMPQSGGLEAVMGSGSGSSGLGAGPGGGPGGGIGGAPVTISPTFQISLTMEGVPDREFGARVVESLEAQKGAIQRLLSGLLTDAARVTYG
ncbi:phage tail tape measure protein [Megalodesulfovibrio paquesii]